MICERVLNESRIMCAATVFAFIYFSTASRHYNHRMEGSSVRMRITSGYSHYQGLAYLSLYKFFISDEWSSKWYQNIPYLKILDHFLFAKIPEIPWKILSFSKIYLVHHFIFNFWDIFFFENHETLLYKLLKSFFQKLGSRGFYRNYK